MSSISVSANVDSFGVNADPTARANAMMQLPARRAFNPVAFDMDMKLWGQYLYNQDLTQE